MEGTSQNSKNCIFVGGVPYEADSSVVMEYFRQFGRVIKVKLNKTRNALRDDKGTKVSGNHRGCGFIEMESKEGLMKVLSSPEHVIMGHKLDCRLAMTNRERKAYHQSLNQERRKIFIGKLSKTVTKEQIESYFSQMVEIEETTLIKKDKKDFAICFLLLRDKYSGDVLAGKTFEISPGTTVECQIALFPQQLHQRKANEGLHNDSGNGADQAGDMLEDQEEDHYFDIESECYYPEQELPKSAQENDTKCQKLEVGTPKLVTDLERCSYPKCASESVRPKHQNTQKSRISKKCSLEESGENPAPRVTSSSNLSWNWHKQQVDDNYHKLPSSTSTLDVGSAPEEPSQEQHSMHSNQQKQGSFMANPHQRSRKDRQWMEKVARHSNCAIWQHQTNQYHGRHQSCSNSSLPTDNQHQMEKVRDWSEANYDRDWNSSISHSHIGHNVSWSRFGSGQVAHHQYPDISASFLNPWGAQLYSEPYGFHNSNHLFKYPLSSNTLQPGPIEQMRPGMYPGISLGSQEGPLLHSEKPYLGKPAEYHQQHSNQHKQHKTWTAANQESNGPAPSELQVPKDKQQWQPQDTSGPLNTLGRQLGSSRLTKPAASKTSGYSPFRF